ncbi:MAG: hypothetical protein HFG26_01910 [Provencibacterium sp.]|jgi:hypothetical protein|nr:hypothetical protein [Provencibacterium sp.]
MRKILSGVMAAALCLSFSVSAFAASGYSSTSSTPSVAQVETQAETAINDAISAGAAAAVVSFRNVTRLSAEAIQSVADKAAAADVASTIHVDKVVGGAVVNRWYIDPAKAGNLTGTLNLDVKVDSKSVASTVNLFDRYFTNEISVVSLGQQGSFGMDMSLAVKVDLQNLDTSKLVFYSYDKATNTFMQIPAAAYFIDVNGYLHFTTAVGGDILITDSVLTKK